MESPTPTHATSAPVVTAGPASQQKSPIALYVVIGVLLLIIGGLTMYVVNLQQALTLAQAQMVQTPSPLPPTTGEPSVTVPSGNPEEAPLVAPDGYATKETLCYSFFYPSEWQVTDSNDCSQRIRGSKDGNMYSFSIEPIYVSSTVSQNSSAELAQKRTIQNTLVQNEITTVDSIPAQKIVEVDQAGSNDSYTVSYFVHTQDRFRRLTPSVVGFQISTHYYEQDKPSLVEAQEALLKEVVSSIRFKK